MSAAPAALAVSVEALGVQVRIDAVPSLVAPLRRAWASCLTEGGGAPDVVVDVGALQSVTPAESNDVLLERITQEVTLQAIAARAGRLLMLHACAVADPSTGRVLVCVGRSGTGKTTLASVLGRRWAYVTDETAAINELGRVLRYPKPLSLHGPDGTTKLQVAPSELGMTAASGALQLGALVLLDRRPGAPEAEVSPVPTVPAIALLAEHASYLAHLARPLGRIADLVHRAGGLRRVTYGEATQVDPVARDLLRSDA